MIERGQPVTLTGIAFSPDTGSLDPNSLEWVSDLQGVLGSGSQLSLNRLRAGKHTITLRARAADGTTAEASVQIEVREPGTAQTHLDNAPRPSGSGS